MRIVCPSCDAAYEVPRSLLGDGDQMVRCARCGKEWLPEPVVLPGGPPLELPTLATLHNPTDPPAATAPPDFNPFVSSRDAQGLDAERDAIPPTTPTPPEPTPPTPTANKLTLALAWLASLALFAAAAAALILKRTEIQSAWPNAIRLYRLVGLE